ncbi:MAG: T9SS type A sorting domain-containing protein [candidate division Zixibacteria bacterium]|nr:T9SS type A sorting domain-containing protein [candidate division Zixibacteria bacterium]
MVKGDLPLTLQDRIGWRLEQAGDMNGDGFDDIMFSSQNFAGGEPGDVWILKGSVDIVTDAEDDVDLALPETFQLDQNYPNPFNPETTIGFSLERKSHVKLFIYDTLGRRIRTLLSQEFSAGEHEVSWDGRNDDGQQVSSGAYFYSATIGDVVNSRRMISLK